MPEFVYATLSLTMYFGRITLGPEPNQPRDTDPFVRRTYTNLAERKGVFGGHVAHPPTPGSRTPSLKCSTHTILHG